MTSPTGNQRTGEQPVTQPPSYEQQNWLPTGQGMVALTTSRAADVLVLAAAPTFAVMAWLSATSPAADVLCSAASQASSIDGMTLMYLLMSAFHAAPWMKRIAGRRGAARRP